MSVVVVGVDAQVVALLLARVAWLEDANTASESERARLEEQVGRLEAEHERLQGDLGRLRGARDRLEHANQRLRDAIEALRRAAKRQAAPLSKGDPNPKPKRAGRRAGAGYGARGTGERRSASTGSSPSSCPIVARVWRRGGRRAGRDPAGRGLPEPIGVITRFEVPIGRCASCGRRVQPRHPERTSDALGAAGAQLGARAVALASWLRTGLGSARARSPDCSASSAWR
jgi:hypothetical protein